MQPNDAQSSADALAHLRAIRQLMENATYYQALTARGALAGGVGGLGLAAWQLFFPPTTVAFLNQWLTMLLAVTAVNFLHLHANAKLHGTQLLSPNFIRTFRATAPAFASGLLLSQTVGWGNPTLMAILWILSTGIALLAAVPMVPRAIGWLGLAFFLAGTLSLVAYQLGQDSSRLAPIYMGLSFGLFDLVYAIVVSFQSRKANRIQPPEPAL